MRKTDHKVEGTSREMTAIISECECPICGKYQMMIVEKDDTPHFLLGLCPHFDGWDWPNIMYFSKEPRGINV